MSLRSASGTALLPAILAAVLALSACGEDQRNITSPEQQSQELAATVLRAELPDVNDYTLRVRKDPAPAVDTFAEVPRLSTAQIAQATDGTIWAVTQGRARGVDIARVLSIDPSGTVTERATGYRGLRGVAVDAAGTLYLSSNSLGQVYSLQTDSTVTRLATGMTGAGQVALSPDESVLYATSPGDDRILEITLNPLAVATLATDTPIVSPRTLTFDDQGRLYVGSSGNPEIMRVDLNAPGGTYPVETFARIPATTIGTMEWSDGTLWVTGASRLYRVPADGSDVYNFLGSALSGRTDADPGSLAQFVTPLGMIVDVNAQIIYVGDSGPNSAIRRILLGQSQETGTWLPEYADGTAYRVIPTSWAFGLDTGDRIDIPSFEGGASVGSLATGISEDRLSIFGLRDHRVWVQLEIYRLL